MLHYLGTDVPIKNLADSTSPSVGILGTLVCSGSLYNRDYAHVIPVDMAELEVFDMEINTTTATHSGSANHLHGMSTIFT